ncbi:MAG: WD40/YVTN/BNR-like repeat-containing protein, partial [Planctomycetota bacterium]
RHRISRSLSVLAASGAALLLGLTATGAQAPSDGDHSAHLRAWDAHEAMTQTSPYWAERWSYVGPTNISGRIADVAVADRGSSRRLYAGSCCGGVWASDDLGETWEPVFDREASTAIGAIAVAPSNPDILWVGTGESNIFRSSYTGVGVYRSTDNARTFQHMGLTDTGTIGRIVAHPTDPNIVYVASAGQEWVENEMRGVFKTTDGGQTWTHTLKISPKTGVNDLVMDPSDPNTLYARAWQRQRRKWNDPRVEPGFSEGGIFKTTDAGRTWTRLTNGLPPSNVLGRIGIDVARSNPNVVYGYIDNYECDTQAAPGSRNPGGSAADCVTRGNEVYRSNDKGDTWTRVSGQDEEQRAFVKMMGASYAWVFGNIRVDPTDENTVYTLALGVSVSRDGGRTFERIGQSWPGGPPAGSGSGRSGGDNHGMWIDPANPHFIVLGNDSGFRTSTDGGQTWQRADLPVQTIFSTHADMDTPFRVYASVQDHGSFRAPIDISGGRENLPAMPWERAPGGEYTQHAVDPRNPNILYTGKLSRTDFSVPAPAGGRGGGAGRGGRGAEAPAGPQRTTNIRPQIAAGEDPLRMQVLAPIEISPHDPDTVYFGTQYLYRTRDRGATWERMTDDMSYGDPARIGDIPHQLVITISESPVKQGLIYTGTDDGRLWVSIDDGEEFRELTAGLPKLQWIAKVLASQHDEATVYVAQQGRYDEDFAVRLYKSTDYGGSFTSIAGNIPGGPINMIREDPENPNVLYAANDFGVYVTTNGGEHWDVLGGNLPSVAVMDFIVHPRDRMLVIATHGRGLWAIDVSQIN